MSTSIHCFDTSVKELYKICTRQKCLEINKKSYEIGTEFMIEFRKKLPEGFRSIFSSRVLSKVKGKRKKR